jgi:hypothetical protein
MIQTECTRQLELFEVGRQTVTVDFAGGQVVSDAGLLPLRQLETPKTANLATNRSQSPLQHPRATFRANQLST